jgi:phosphoglycolate phosphatase
MHNMNNAAIKGILFDLDGTLLDTAPDMADALNMQRQKHQLPPLPFEYIRPFVGYGSRTILKIGFDMDEAHPHYVEMVQQYLDLYETCLTQKTNFFPYVNDVLAQLDNAGLPWGIVTNKPSRFTLPLLDYFQLTKRASCLVCGDTLPKRKPDPDQILFASTKMRIPTSELVYVGDTNIDVLASQNANVRSLIALYGYIQQEDDPYTWQATGYLQSMLDIIPWLQSHHALSLA